MHHNQAHHDHCFAKSNNRTDRNHGWLNRAENPSRVIENGQRYRVKRFSGPVIRRSILEMKETNAQMCGVPCQKQPLLVDKKKILDFLGMKWLSRQTQEWQYFKKSGKWGVWSKITRNRCFFDIISTICDNRWYMAHIIWADTYLNKSNIYFKLKNMPQKKNQFVDIGRCFGNCRGRDGQNFMVRFLNKGWLLLVPKLNDIILLILY